MWGGAGQGETSSVVQICQSSFGWLQSYASESVGWGGVAEPWWVIEVLLRLVNSDLLTQHVWLAEKLLIRQHAGHGWWSGLLAPEAKAHLFSAPAGREN